jgi:hypothetical protein
MPSSLNQRPISARRISSRQKEASDLLPRQGFVQPGCQQRMLAHWKPHQCPSHFSSRYEPPPSRLHLIHPLSHLTYPLTTQTSSTGCNAIPGKHGSPTQKPRKPIQRRTLRSQDSFPRSIPFRYLPIVLSIPMHTTPFPHKLSLLPSSPTLLGLYHYLCWCWEGILRQVGGLS